MHAFCMGPYSFRFSTKYCRFYFSRTIGVLHIQVCIFKNTPDSQTLSYIGIVVQMGHGIGGNYSIHISVCTGDFIVTNR